MSIFSPFRNISSFGICFSKPFAFQIVVLSVLFIFAFCRFIYICFQFLESFEYFFYSYLFVHPFSYFIFLEILIFPQIFYCLYFLLVSLVLSVQLSAHMIFDLLFLCPVVLVFLDLEFVFFP